MLGYMYDWRSDEIPEARVLRRNPNGELTVRRQSLRKSLRQWATPGERAQLALSHIAGLWPLVAIVGLTVALLWSAGYSEP